MAYNFAGEFTIATSREEAFAVLSATPRFAPLMPTYKSHAMREDGSADVEVKVGVGKVRGTGKVNLMLEECVAPERARYLGKGEVMGGAFNLKAGFDLEELGPRVNWEGELAIFGKLVSLAGGLVKPVAERDINKMIESLQIALGGAEEPVVAVSTAPRAGVFARFIAWLKGLFGRGGTSQL